MGNFANYSNMTDLMTAIGNKIKALNGAYIFKGSIDFASLPATLASTMVGYVYNINEQFTTDSRFIEGSGKVYPAGTNVAIADVGSAGSPDLKFDVISSFVDVAAIEAAIAAVAAMIEAPFDATAAYSIGDFVTKDNVLYIFTSAHTANTAWNSSEVSQTTVLDIIAAVETTLNGKINNVSAMVAPEFDATSAYAIGDIVTKDGELYRFIAAHTASDPWSTSEVSGTTVETLIKSCESSISANTTAIGTIAGDLADAFDASTTYAIGDVVVYQNQLYKFTAAHTGAWSTSDVAVATVDDLISDLGTAVDGKIAVVAEDLADAFDSTAAYAIGDVVVYQNQLYKFTAAHTGVWNASDATAITVESLISAAEPDPLTTAQVR